MKGDRRALRFLGISASVAGIAVVAVWLLFPTRAPATSYSVPAMAELRVTLSDSGFDFHSVCLARSEPAGAQIEQIFLCYGDYKQSPVVPTPGAPTPTPGPVPAPPPPPFLAAAYEEWLADFDAGTGVLEGIVAPCFDVWAGVVWAELEMTVQMDKGGGVASGTATYTVDWVAPLDCADGLVITGPVTMTPLAQSHDDDIWGPNPGETGPDGCSDWEELGDTAGGGGLRDPFNFWDFYDVPLGTPPVRDGTIVIGDILAVVARFGAGGDPTGDPLSAPPAAPAYHTAFDRSSSLGPDVWNLGPPDGSIVIGDIQAVQAQFGHDCSAAP